VALTWRVVAVVALIGAGLGAAGFGFADCLLVGGGCGAMLALVSYLRTGS
jgi:hypothetical protein